MTKQGLVLEILMLKGTRCYFVKKGLSQHDHTRYSNFIHGEFHNSAFSNIDLATQMIELPAAVRLLNV